MEKGNKGITLIALVITIIVLLILAGVTIATLTGDNGLLQKATTAKEENEQAKELELIKLAVGAAKIAGEGTITKDILNSELRNSFNDNKSVFENNEKFYYNGYIIDKDGKVEEGKLLPDEYQQVEYIESTGTQYIDTNLNAQQHKYITVEIEGKYTELKSNQKIFCAGYWNSSQNNSWFLMGQTSELGFIGQIGIGGTEKTVTDADTKKHFFGLDSISNQAKIDSYSIDLGDIESKDINYNYVLFSGRNGSNITSKSFFRMYSCKIIENNQTILHLIPCLDSNNKACMYDLISNNLLYNSDNGDDFIVGPDI